VCWEYWTRFASLTSGASKHSNATLAGSVLAALLAGAGAHTLIASPGSPSPSKQGDGAPVVLVPEFNGLTTVMDGLKTNISKQNDLLKALLSQNPSPRESHNSSDYSRQIEIMNTSTNDAKEDVKHIKETMATKESSALIDEKVMRLQEQMKRANDLRKELQHIADVIGTGNGELGKELPMLLASSQQIAKDLDPPQALPSSDKKTNAGSGDSNTIAASLKTLAGIAKTEDNAYIRGLPNQAVVSKTDSIEIFERTTDGAPCTIRWRLESRTADKVTLSIFDKDCQTSTSPNPYKLDVDYKGKQLPGTKSEVSLDRIERTTWWSLSDKSAVLALYRK
jgi:hypothetical protein